MNISEVIKKFLTRFKEVRTYVCPVCGSTNIGYSTIVRNFFEVLAYGENCKYDRCAICNNCGFKTAYYPEESNGDLKELKVKLEIRGKND